MTRNVETRMQLTAERGREGVDLTGDERVTLGKQETARPWTSWECRNDETVGFLDDGNDRVQFPHTSRTKRHLFGVISTNEGAFQGQIVVRTSSQGNFGWAGGAPPEPIALEDYPKGVASVDTAAPLSVSNMMVMTMVLTEPFLDLTRADTGIFFYLEGEEEDDYRLFNR